jgi:uncharacterized membrane protein (UPF0127 family)
MQVGLKFKGKKIVVEASRVGFFGRIRGLMFREGRGCPALLFEFNRNVNYAIHSCFVKFPFIAVWLDGDNKIVEIKEIYPWKFSIKPKKSFKKLLEVPINEKYHLIVKVLVGVQKHL